MKIIKLLLLLTILSLNSTTYVAEIENKENVEIVINGKIIFDFEDNIYCIRDVKTNQLYCPTNLEFFVHDLSSNSDIMAKFKLKVDEVTAKRTNASIISITYTNEDENTNEQNGDVVVNIENAEINHPNEDPIEFEERGYWLWNHCRNQ